MVGHSAHDDAFYVDKAQMKEYEKKDPIGLLEKALLEEGILDPAKIAAIKAEIDEDIERATEIAINSPMPEAHWAAEGVYAD
jgi:2-oxoisovalerate dehydrogenase E1 component alpha subunit